MPYPRPLIRSANRKGVIVGGRIEPAMARAQRSWLQGVLRRIRDDARSFAPVDLGAFRRSIVYRTTLKRGVEVEGEVYSTDTPRAKVAVIEYGRTPGKKMPPKGALLGWMSRHGIPASAEFLVRRKIGKEGIKAKEPFRKAWVRSRGLVRSQARHLQSALVRELNR